MKFKVFFIVLTTFAFISCATVPKGSEKEWEPLSSGVSRLDCREKNYEYHIVKLNLDDGWKPEALPEEKGWVKNWSVKEFAKKRGLTVAINTTPFIKKGFKSKLLGINVKEYKKYSEENNRYSAVAFFRDEKGGLKAEIFDSQKELEGKAPEYAFGGYFTVLRNGKIYEYKKIHAYRMGIGISDNGKNLYLMCGKKMTYSDCGEIFRRYGAETAMEFDGGKSTQMNLNGKSLLIKPYTRKVPAILGFKK